MLEGAAIGVVILGTLAVVILPFVYFSLARSGLRTLAGRSDERADYAARHGLRYVEDDDWDTVQVPVRLFTDIKSSPYWVRRVAHGNFRRWPVRVFDVDITGTYSGMDQGQHFRRHLCVLVQLAVSAPSTTIKPLDRIDRILSRREPSLDVGDPAFDRRYSLTTEDASWLRQLLDPGTRVWLRSEASDVRWDVTDSVLIAARPWVSRPAMATAGSIRGRLFGGTANVPPLEEAVHLADKIERLGAHRLR